jgi:hypothetical protein
MMIAVVSSCIWVATMVFLFVCAARNQRSGYRKPARRVSLLEEGWTWLQEIKAAMDEPAQPPAQALKVSKPTAAVPPDTTVEQLARLNLALQVNLAAPVITTSQTENQSPVEEHAAPATTPQVRG